MSTVISGISLVMGWICRRGLLNLAIEAGSIQVVLPRIFTPATPPAPMVRPGGNIDLNYCCTR